MASTDAAAGSKTVRIVTGATLIMVGCAFNNFMLELMIKCVVPPWPCTSVLPLTYHTTCVCLTVWWVGVCLCVCVCVAVSVCMAVWRCGGVVVRVCLLLLNVAHTAPWVGLIMHAVATRVLQ